MEPKKINVDIGPIGEYIKASDALENEIIHKLRKKTIEQMDGIIEEFESNLFERSDKCKLTGLPYNKK